MNTLRFDGKVALVTGAGTGLGRGYALLLASRGAKVIVNNRVSGQQEVGDFSRSADLVVEDIRQAGGIAVADYNSVLDGERVITTALDNFGRIDILINNAGILRDKSFPRMAEEDWDAVLGVHLKGVFLLTQMAFALFKKQGYGRIVMTTSNSGFYGNFGQANYTAAKMGIVGLARTVAIEGDKYNVLCNVISPFAASKLTEGKFSPDLYKEAKPELIAPVVAYLCHESYTENGTIIESTLGWAGKIHIVHSKGALLRKSLSDSVTIEDVQDNWKKIVDTNNAEFCKSVKDRLNNGDNTVERLKFHDGGSVSNTRFEFTKKDAILYALAVGASVERPEDFKYLYENHEDFNQIPSFFIQPAARAYLESDIGSTAIPGKVLTCNNILHGEQYLEIVENVPHEGKLYSTIRQVELLDKGTAGVLVLDVDTFNIQNKLVLRNQIVIFASGCGNFGGSRTGTRTIPLIPKPKRNPDKSILYKTDVNQAALFRLVGDSNPLHIDPKVAKVFGFEKPILHGACILGISLRIVLGAFTDCDSNLFKAVKARFSKPVIPGQTLRVDMWQEGNRINFETIVVENNTIAIDGAYVDLKSVWKNPNVKA